MPLLALPLHARSQDLQQGTEAVPLLETVVVTGKVAGPGMWRVEHGDNTLWILGTVTPVPRDIQWDSTEALATLADAGQVLWSPRFSVSVDGNSFAKATLAMGAFNAQRNPDGRTLEQVLDPQVHARWQRLRQRYLPRQRGLDRKRPLVVAGELYRAALRRHGLDPASIVTSTLSTAAREQDITSVTPRHVLQLSTAQARALIKDTRAADLHDQACLEATMDLIEHALPQLITTANAWANGEVERIDTTSSSARQKECLDAFGNSDVLAGHGIPDIRRTLAALWLEQAEAALRSRRSTLAVMSIDALAGADGYLEALARRGYTIHSP